MKVLKSQLFMNGMDDLVKFVHVNKIEREDILTITVEPQFNYTLFFYGDPEKEEINKGFFGW